MTIQNAYKELAISLLKIYGTQESKSIANMVFEHLTGWGNSERILHKNMVLNENQSGLLEIFISKLLKKEPIQYVLNEAWFCGMKFYVDEHVLIPRPETEELVDWAVELIDNSSKKIVEILDIGSGSGCIPIAIKKKVLKETCITSIDINEQILEVARRNANTLGAAVQFKQIDFLNQSNWENLPSYDIVISNPPYIPLFEKAEMQGNVVDYEPHLALFVPDEDALLFYENIALFARNHLKPDGELLVEIHELLGNATLELFEKEGFECYLKKDMQGKDRMIKAYK